MAEMKKLKRKIKKGLATVGKVCGLENKLGKVIRVDIGLKRF